MWLLGAALSWAIEARGYIVKKDDRRFDGMIRWKASSRIYIVTLAGPTAVDFEVAPADVKELRIAEPAGLREAIKAAQDGRNDAALPALEKIAQDYAMLQWDEPATRWLAECLLRDGKADQAVKTCERVTDRKPDAGFAGDLAPVYWRALMAAGRTARLGDLLDAADKSPLPELQARGLIMRGELLRKQGDLKTALRDGYLRAIVLCDRAKAARAEALFRAISCFEELGQVSHAERMRKVLQTEHPDSEWAQRLKAGARP
jgi:TolA-binding protein